MNIWLRWIKLWLTCGLGHHAPVRSIQLLDNGTYTECPRCHQASYDRAHFSRTVHLGPSYWDVARGLYDRSLEP